MLNIKYKGYEIYTENPKFIKLAEEIIDDKYNIEKEFKVTPRNYVVKIGFEGESYILKKPRNEQRIIQRRLKTFFSKGESLTTFLNINKLRKKGLSELYEPILAGVKREKGFIKESFLVTENIDGEIKYDYRKYSFEDRRKIVEVLEKLHSYGVYHGDANHTNFIYTDKGIRIIDTQGKIGWTNFKQHYDFITLDDCIKEIYNLHKFNKKQISYWIAYWMKNYKKSGLNKKMSSLKEKFRKR